MAEHNDLGKVGEDKAVAFLVANGYEILERNYRYLKGEIDIIAQIENQVVAVEVKTRSTLVHGLPQDFIKPAKIKLLVRTMDHYVTTNVLEYSVRFDVISVFKNDSKELEVEHLIDAFYHF